MSGYFVKPPRSVEAYSVDWAFQHLEPGEEIDTDLGWVIHPDTSGLGGLSIAGAASTATVTTVSLAGGMAGEAYLVSSTITTNQGRQLQRALTVRVANA